MTYTSDYIHHRRSFAAHTSDGPENSWSMSAWARGLSWKLSWSRYGPVFQELWAPPNYCAICRPAMYMLLHFLVYITGDVYKRLYTSPALVRRANLRWTLSVIFWTRCRWMKRLKSNEKLACMRGSSWAPMLKRAETARRICTPTPEKETKNERLER